jgi:hypothetical protein
VCRFLELFLLIDDRLSTDACHLNSYVMLKKFYQQYQLTVLTGSATVYFYTFLSILNLWDSWMVIFYVVSLFLFLGSLASDLTD